MEYNISTRMLKRVLSIQSKSDSTSSYHKDKIVDGDIDMRNYVKSVLSSDKVYHYEDDYGNIYAIKGSVSLYDCIVAHMDTVHSRESAFEINTLGDYLYAFNPKEIRQIGIGGDDQVGVYMALQALKDRDNIKAVFYRNEEIGKLGSSYSIKNHKDFYKDCKFVIQNDRRGYKDFITYSGGIDICSKKFKKDAKKIYKKYGFNDVKGVTTDVDTLVKGQIGISCINLSCGYHREHSDEEIVNIKQVENTYKLNNALFDSLKEQYEYTYTPAKTSSYTTSYNAQPSFSTTINNKSEGNIYKNNDSSERIGVFNDIDLDRYDEFDYFCKLKGKTNLYILKDSESIEVPMKGYKCEKCGNTGTTYFIPDENKFFCIACNDFIKDSNAIRDLRISLIVEDSGHKFYHNRVSNRWIKDEAVWLDKSTTYSNKS